MPTYPPGGHDFPAGFSTSVHSRSPYDFPAAFTSAAHQRRGRTRHAAPAPIHTPRGPVVADTNNPYAGLFTGSALDQANKIADYLLGPYKDQYNQQLAARHALDATRLKQLQDYIAGIAAQFQGVAPAVLAAYRAASGDQSQIAQGFSGDIRDAVQASANQDNALLSEIGAPQGQMIPGQQATDVGDVTYGLGGWIPATLMSQLGARAYADAAKLPATISARGLSAVSDLVGSQQEADAAAQAAYDQVLAQRPGNVLDLYGQIKDRQAAALEAKQKAKADALKARQDVYDAKTKQAEDLTKSTGYLYVVTKGGTVKRATGRNGKPIYTGDLELVTDKATGITRALNPQTGELVWARQTQTPQPGAAAEPPKTITGPDGLYAWEPSKDGKTWNLRPVGPRKQPTDRPPSTFQGPDGLYYWKRTPKGWEPTPIGPRKPADLPDVNYQKVGNNVVAFWFDPKTNKPQQQIVYQGTPDQKLQVVQTGDGGYDIVDLSVPGGEVVKSFPGVTQTIGGGSGGDQKTYRLADGRLAIMGTDANGNPTLIPIDPTKRPTRPRGSQGSDLSPYLDADTGQPMTWDDVKEAITTIRKAIYGEKGNLKPGQRPLAQIIKTARSFGIPISLWGPMVVKAFGIPTSPKDLKYMGFEKLYRTAVFLGYDPQPGDPKLNKQGLIDWINEHFPKADAGGRTTQAAGGGFGTRLVAFAKQQIGQPYKWGAESRAEGGFDCSGLIDWALRQEGYDGPRVTSYRLATMGTEVKLKDIQPGDLIITHGGGHVVMYAGNGKVIAAPHTGTDVQYQPLSMHKDGIVTIRRLGDDAAREATEQAPSAGETPGTAPSAPGGNVQANMFRSYMRARNSPLAGLAQNFVNAGVKYGVDPRLLVAIAGAESTWGQSKFAKRFKNPFGWLGHSFGSWAEAIDAIAKHIREYYFDGQGLTTVEKMAGLYVDVKKDPDGYRRWLSNVTRVLTDLGGNPDALRLGG